MKLHEMKQKRNTIAKDMRALHEKIGDNAWTDEQRAEWNRAKAELDALDEQIQKWQDKMSDQIDRYTAKFSALSARIMRRRTGKRRWKRSALRHLTVFCVPDLQN